MIADPLPRAIASCPVVRCGEAVVVVLAFVGVILALGCSRAIDRTAIQDAHLAMRVKTALVNDAALGARVIEVHASGGVVRLSGRVASEAEARRAVALARSVDGVRDVRSGLRIGLPQSRLMGEHLHVDRQAESESAGAEEERRLLAIGASLAFSNPTARRLASGTKIDPLVRIGSGDGLGPSFGFSWFSTDLSSRSRPAHVIGRVRIKPVMGGLAYTFRQRGVSASLSLVGGVAFNSVSMPDQLAEAELALEVDNSFVWRSGVSVWYDLNDRIAFNAFGGYLVTRPRVTSLEEGRLEKRALKADTALATVGIAYKVF